MALREVLADLRVRVRGTEQLQRANLQIGGAVQGLRAARAALGGAAVALTAALGVRQIASFTREMINAGDEIDKTSQRLGMSVGELQRWQYMANRAGVEAGSLTRFVDALGRNAFQAARGARQQADGFRELGINVRGAGGQLKSTDQLMREVTTGLASMTDRTRAAALAQVLMGRGAAALMPLINQGAEGLAQLNARFEELGGGLSEDMVRAAAAAQDAMTDFDLAMTSIKGQLAVSFLPALTRAITAFSEWAGRVSNVLRQSNAFRVAMWALTAAAIALGVALAPVALTIATLVAPFVILFLVVEDLVTMFEGGESAIGHFIDAIFGVGSTVTVVRTLTAAWEGLVHAVRSAWAAMTGGEAPAASGRVNVGTQDEAAASQARAAALRGELRGTRGQSREDALAAANAARAAAGLEPLGGARVPVAGLGAEPRVSRRNVRGGGGTTTNNVTAPISVTVEGAAEPEATGRAVAAAIDARFRPEIAAAAMRLPQAGGA